ncbi:MAG: histidine kinase [Bacteroidetes bacterium]|nr:MAG: histidine kinase [Bacteroidota bacterium]
MQHPVFQSIKTISIYFGVWILLAGIQFSILAFQYHFPFNIALADSLVFNLLFGVIGLPLWFVVRYSSPSKKNRFNLIFNHLTSFVLIIVIWFGTGYSILSLIFQDEEVYTNFLTLSIPVRLISGLFLYILVGLAFYLLIYSYNLQEKAEMEARLNTLLKETELNMLKSQINPHFLFNSLNSISSLTVSNPEKARDMVIKLSDFLRYSVSSGADSMTPLFRELENIQRYLEIEKVRFGEKLVYDLRVGQECMDQNIPVMLLQPLYENAIKHGVYESTEQVRIETTCRVESEYMEITIFNDFDPDAVPRKGAGVGLMNIRERLRLTYHRRDLLSIWKEKNRFFVQLRIPK